MRRLSAAVVVAVLALSAPASALAQSAGDDQYSDPFAGEQQDQQQNQAPPSSGGSTTPVAPSAPAPVAQPASSAPATTLPYTGLPALAMSGLGALLIAAGAGLRRSSR
jgi:hypothetical protein